MHMDVYTKRLGQGFPLFLAARRGAHRHFLQNFVCFLLPFFLLTLASESTKESISYRPLRYTHVVGQTDWYTCGAAAVAMLLTYYYGDPATEEEVLEVAIEETKKSGN